ncbi:SH3 domain-containing protein [Sedimentitalea nanhaiensis]|uniref:SH3 domain-containing protein n=1 Tax=Sedimentitalea nanhaiensis TaxID=999627 RepID=A0A1I6X646_9RHOB|nr:SH3 domain-containing protein [Sedimentitalea nanhaiensis]SFT33765.1 SH3 domain-containing protein [Sedimentitalea nanhaiensis]
MRRAILAALAAALLGAVPEAGSADAGSGQYYEVVGVEGEDMLKLRAGPGIGFKIILGLPNGTILRIHGCEQTGGTRWCKVSLKQSRKLKGYASWAYLREM